MRKIKIGGSCASLLNISDIRINAIILIKGDQLKEGMKKAILMVNSGHTISRAARLNKVDRSGLSRNITNIKKWDEIIRSGYLNLT